MVGRDGPLPLACSGARGGSPGGATAEGGLGHPAAAQRFHRASCTWYCLYATTRRLQSSNLSASELCLCVCRGRADGLDLPFLPECFFCAAFRTTVSPTVCGFLGSSAFAATPDDIISPRVSAPAAM